MPAAYRSETSVHKDVMAALSTGRAQVTALRTSFRGSAEYNTTVKNIQANKGDKRCLVVKKGCPHCDAIKSTYRAVVEYEALPLHLRNKIRAVPFRMELGEGGKWVTEADVPLKTAKRAAQRTPPTDSLESIVSQQPS
jgi:hypothetical protein